MTSKQLLDLLDNEASDVKGQPIVVRDEHGTVYPTQGAVYEPTDDGKGQVVIFIARRNAGELTTFEDAADATDAPEEEA